MARPRAIPGAFPQRGTTIPPEAGDQIAFAPDDANPLVTNRQPAR